MNLLVVILNRPERLEELLECYIEHELPGATVIDSVGMGSILGREIPIFAGFRDIFAGSPSGKVLLSLVDSDAKISEALDSIDVAMNKEGGPVNAISFVIPVTQVRGPKRRPNPGAPQDSSSS